jgi:hypothetical protein
MMMLMMTMKNKNFGGGRSYREIRSLQLLVEVSQPAGFPSFTAGDAC